MKKTVSILLACVLLASLGLTALAEEAEGFTIEGLPEFGEEEVVIIFTEETDPIPTEAPSEAGESGETAASPTPAEPTAGPTATEVLPAEESGETAASRPEADATEEAASAGRNPAAVIIAVAAVAGLGIFAGFTMKKRNSAGK